MQYERCRLQTVEFRLDGTEVFRAFGQNQHLASLLDCLTHLGGDGFGSGLILGEMPKNVLDACIGGQFDPCVARSRQHFQIVRRSGRLGRRVADWPALHEDDWLLTIAADRRRRQAQHLFGLGPFQDRVE
jgi:hypothetical protein